MPRTVRGWPPPRRVGVEDGFAGRAGEGQVHPDIGGQGCVPRQPSGTCRSVHAPIWIPAHGGGRSARADGDLARVFHDDRSPDSVIRNHDPATDMGVECDEDTFCWVSINVSIPTTAASTASFAARICRPGHRTAMRHSHPAEQCDGSDPRAHKTGPGQT